MRTIEFQDFEITTNAREREIRIHKNMRNMKREFRSSLFVEINDKIEEVPVDGRWYTVGDYYVKIKHLHK